MKKNKLQGDGGETMIAQGVKVEGDFVSEGNIILEGDLSGSIKAAGNLTIGDRAEVEASIEAADVFVAGSVKGNIRANGRLEITSSSHIEGDIHASVLKIDAGARINGSISMASVAQPVEEEKENLAEPDQATPGSSEDDE